MRLESTSLRCLLLGLAVGLCHVSPAKAEIYQFVDEDGVVHFTNVPSGDPRFKAVEDPTRSGSKARARKLDSGARARGEAARPSREQVRVRPSRSETDEYDGYIREASERFNIPEALIRAVMAVESNFDPTAVSHAGAEGLMQLMPATAAQMGVEDTFDPRQNILGGARYLRQLANTFGGELVLTLAAYNAGQQRVSKHGDIPPIAETQIYVRRVLQLYYHYKKTYGPPAEESEP